MIWIKKAVLALALAAGLSCGRAEIKKSEPDFMDGCYTVDDPVSVAFDGVELFVPGDYHGSVVEFALYMRGGISAGHPRARKLEEIIFYDSELCELPDVYERAYGVTNSEDIIWMNDSKFFDELGRSDFFYMLLNGIDHVLSHEQGHVLLQERLDGMTDELHGMVPINIDGYPWSLEDKRHYIVDQYGYFIEMAHVYDNQERFQDNPYFENNILPFLQQHPERAAEVTDFIDSWNLYFLYVSRAYHDAQLEFLIQEKAIDPAYREALSRENIFPILYGLQEVQKNNAMAKVEAIAGPQTGNGFYEENRWSFKDWCPL